MSNPAAARQSIPGLMSGNVMGQPASGPQNSLASFVSAKSLPGREEFTEKRPEKKCISCGKTLSGAAKFCTSCGNKM